MFPKPALLLAVAVAFAVKNLLCYKGPKQQPHKEANEEGEAACYARRYPDLFKGFCRNEITKCPRGSALREHYLEYGVAEGRIWGCGDDDSDPVNNNRMHVRIYDAGKVAMSLVPAGKKVALESEPGEKIRSRCGGESVWSDDPFWKNAVQLPRLCRGENGEVDEKDSLDQLSVKELKDTLVMYTRCGQFCVFHPTTILGGTIRGWSLASDNHGDGGCFEPVADMSDHGCAKFHKKWIEWMKQTRRDTLITKDPHTSTNKQNTSQCDALESSDKFSWDYSTGSVVLHHRPEEQVCGPSILIIGAMKCGTNSVGDLLSKHPRIVTNRCFNRNKEHCDINHFQGGIKGIWEAHGFTHVYNEYKDNEEWKTRYARILPATNGVDQMTFDKSPSYFNTELFPGVARRAKDTVPNAKVIVTLCDPAERLFAEYYHQQHWTKDGFDLFYHDAGISVPSNFSEFVALFHDESKLCKNKPDYCDAHRRFYLRTGIYHKHLQEWQDAFGEHNVLVLRMGSDPAESTRQILQHVGLPQEEYPWEAATKNVKKVFSNSNYEGRASAHFSHGAAMDWLSGYYAPHNEHLASVLGSKWPLDWSGSEKRVSALL